MCRILCFLWLGAILGESGIARTVERGKLSYRISSIEFSDVPIEDVLEFIRTRSEQLDIDEPDPAKKGFNIIVQSVPDQLEPIALSLRGVSIGVLLGTVAEMSGFTVESDSFAVNLVPRDPKVPRAVPSNRPARDTQQKLATIVVPSVEFDEVPFEEAIDYIRARSQELDSSSDPEKRGINLVVMPRRGETEPPTVSLKLRDIPLADLIRYVCEVAGYKPRVVGELVKLYPPDWAQATSPEESR